MGLRKYINDLEFSKKVNYSPIGRKFENSDFVRSVESMGLRKYINDLEFSKKVNYSPIGRKFENSDFVRSVELTKIKIGEVFQKEKWIYKGLAIGSTLISPIVLFVIYGTLKNEKWNKSSLYDDFSNSSDLILNH
ncbi:hypothetical protein KAT36_03145 [Candidatus Pacearchaeota archaeon]|nr:hypothetical protein [Candidatus Pacearchaeota archaeon]